MKPIVLCLMILLSFTEHSYAAKCGPEIVNPVTDVAWHCIFPIRIGGLVQTHNGESEPQDGDAESEAEDSSSDSGDTEEQTVDKSIKVSEDPDTINNPICVCGAKIGLRMSFWEPARMIDTVSDPYCLMAIGDKLANPTPGQLTGDLSRNEYGTRAFQQLHYYIFPVWAILDMFVDFPCIDNRSFDIAMITEVLPHWNNEILAMILNPEAVLFGHPAAQLACAADAAATLVGLPINQLFWCQGSWPSVYPLSGSITSTDYVEANAALAGRGIYMMGRLGALWDPAISECGTVPTAIWRKRNTRLQIAKPVRGNQCLPIGRSGMLWTHAKNPPAAGDNFSWINFRKVSCCVSY